MEVRCHNMHRTIHKGMVIPYRRRQEIFVAAPTAHKERRSTAMRAEYGKEATKQLIASLFF